MRPLDQRGFVITDPATAIAVRHGVTLTDAQADALRQRVAEVRVSLQRWADYWGLSVAACARIRLAAMAEERAYGVNQRRLGRTTNEDRAITHTRRVGWADGRESGPS